MALSPCSMNVLVKDLFFKDVGIQHMISNWPSGLLATLELPFSMIHTFNTICYAGTSLAGWKRTSKNYITGFKVDYYFISIIFIYFLYLCDWTNPSSVSDWVFCICCWTWLLWDMHQTKSSFVCVCAYWGSGKVVNPCAKELQSEKWREKRERRGRCLTLFGQAVWSREEGEWLVRFRVSCPAVALAHAKRKWLRPSHNTLLVLQPGTQECHSHFHMADRSLFWNQTYYSTHSKQHILTLLFPNDSLQIGLLFLHTY